MSDTQLFDLEFASKQTMGNVGLLNTVLKNFIENYDNIEKQTIELLNTRNVTLQEGYIHNLKGVSGNLGLLALHNLCKDLNAQLKQEELVTEPQMLTFNNLVLDTLNCVKTYLGNAETTLATTEQNDLMFDLAKLEKLSSQLQNDELVDSDFAHEIVNSLPKTIPEDLKLKLSISLEEFEYEEAIAALNEIVERVKQA